jgi:glycosyltransferase involved in cell wall biosynthesis
MPWLLWCYDRQSWPRRELVIVDSSPEPLQVAGRDDVRVVTVPPGTGVAWKRNLALQEARGEIITWFDDDDWQHPDKLAWLVEALSNEAPYAGSCHGWFVDLMGLRCAPYRGPKRQIVFNSAGFQRNVALSLPFRDTLQRASDTRWMQDLVARYRRGEVILKREDMFFWLCHQENLSNPARRRRFSEPLETLRRRIGTEAWGDTDDALDALRMRLQGGNGARPAEVGPGRGIVVSAPALTESQPRNEPKRSEDDTQIEGKTPPVGLMIKATVMDAPFLDVMVRHMISQARYPFAERTIVVDRQPAFTGKYRSRPRASQEELDQILEQLLADGIMDHVREVDMTPSLVRQIMERYFAEDAHRVPTHAETGGPIYATLFGLESMTTDYVLQMDADVFFHTGPESWVSQALACMVRDPRLWLMMTHPGPPAGPPGKSLGPLNAPRATWDQELCIWRFRTATTRYFLCDRRKLHRRLQRVPLAQGCVPLERCISNALRRHNAFRGNLGNLDSWHLHAWYHGDPFPRWAPSLAKAIEVGRVPAFQQGNYDLRLDRTRDRREWGELLERVAGDRSASVKVAASGSVGTRQSKAKASSSAPGASHRESAADLRLDGVAPLAVVIPVRNRAGQPLQNVLRSLNWQSAGRPVQVLVVSHGSQPDVDQELSELCDEEAATLIRIGDPSQPWNKPCALNTGIRATLPEVPFVMTMDADMILPPNFFKVALERLKREPPALVLCRASDLPQHVSLPSRREKLMDAFDSLRAKAQLRPSFGTGGIQAAQRSFFFEIRGYDEDLCWWGAMDGDLVKRARLAGLEIEWIENRTAMLHQWHPRKHAVLAHHEKIEQAKRAWQRNHELVRSRSKTMRRNPDGWGGL